MTRTPVPFVSLILPPPISTNALWRNVRISGRQRTLKSADYRTWETNAMLVINTQRPGCVKGAYAMKVTVSNKCRIDLDNCLKSVGDVLQKMGIIENDRLCAKIEIKRGDVEGMSVMVAHTSYDFLDG